MASNCKAVLRSFQHADSFFPSGTVAMSSGLESLNVEGIVDSSDSIERFLLGQLKWRCHHGTVICGPCCEGEAGL